MHAHRKPARAETDSYTFIHLGCFCSTSSSPCTTTQRRSRCSTDTFVGVKTPKRNRQLRVKDLPKVLTWRLIRTRDPSVERRRIYQWAAMPHIGRQTKKSRTY